MFKKKICCVICGEKLSDNRIDELYKPAIDMGYRELIVPMCKECADELMARATDVFIDGEELIIEKRGGQERKE